MDTELPDPGPIPEEQAGLVFYVNDYWLESHAQHFISFPSLELAEAAKEADYSGASITQYKGELEVIYMAIEPSGHAYITSMLWNYYKVETPTVAFFLYAEDPGHAVLQLQQLHSAEVEDRSPTFSK